MAFVWIKITNIVVVICNNVVKKREVSSSTMAFFESEIFVKLPYETDKKPKKIILGKNKMAARSI